MYFTTLFASATLVSLVTAHGIPQHVTVNGKTYTAPLIGAGGNNGPFWTVTDNSPVADTTSSETLCGRVDKKASSSMEVPAGSTLSYYWSSGYSEADTMWPHNTGPLFFYLAKCDGDCNAISGSTKFYKLQEDGLSNGVWKQADLNAGKTVSFKVPADLEPGNYVIRHEVINLASTAEMFPSCQNIKVTGSGSKTLSGKSTTFPGAYSASDAGLTVAGAAVYAIKNNAGYTFPGPPVVGLGSGSGSGSGSSPSSSVSKTVGGTSTSTTDTATSTDANNGAGSPPGTSSDASSTETATETSAAETATETSVTETATGTSATETATETSATETATETDSSSSSATVTSSGSTPTSTGSSGTNCAEAWTACNAKYKGTAEDQANYKCQTDYQSCVAATMANSTAKRMHRRRRAFFDAVSH